MADEVMNNFEEVKVFLMTHHSFAISNYGATSTFG